VLSHMVGGKKTLANELSVIIHRIQRLGRDDPMRATEETALVDVVIRERRRSGVPLGDGAYAILAALGARWLTRHPRAHQGPRVTHVAAHLLRRHHLTLSLGPQGPRGDVSVQDLHRGPLGPRVAHVVPHPAFLRRSTSRPTRISRKRTWTRRQ